MAAKKDDILSAASVIVESEKGQDSQSPRDALAEILTKKLQQEMQEEEEKKRLALEARKRGAQAMEMRRQAELAVQEQCTHMKPWGGPAIGGQRDHQHNIHWICLYCAKEWTNDELPLHLRIPLSLVGGPQ